MKKVTLFLALVFSVLISKAQTWTNVNGRWGYEWLRAPKALFIPSGNGAPSGTASLNGAGYKGQAAFYSDTTAKKLYMFNPKDSTWTDVTGVAGVVGPTMGGTGLTSVTTGDMLYGSATNTWAKLPGAATGNALISGGIATAPSFGKIGLTTHVSGVLPVANGGTGTATPGLIQGANVTITGVWPNQTINSTGGGGGVTTMGTIGSSPNANGASISGSTLTLQPASVLYGGVVSTDSQSFKGNKYFFDSVGIGTRTPQNGFHLSLPSSSTTGAGTFMRVTDSRTTGNYRIAGMYLETNTNLTQLFSTTGDGLSFEPFSSKRGYYIRNLTNNGGIFATTNNNGLERKSLSLIGDSVGIGWGHFFTGAAYGGGFGGYPTLVGGQATGNGVAVGWSATATNVEAVAIGPQTIANAFATIAIGDGARAQADSATGNQIVMGDASFAYGNINYFIGGGAGIGHGKDYVMCLGCQGASTSYNLDVSPAKHTALLGWYDETSSHFSGGAGLYNDWYLGGPYRSTVAHDITLNITSMIGGDVNGKNFKIRGSRGTGAGAPGDIVFETGDAVASDTILQASTAKFTIKGNGDLLAGKMPIGANSDSALLWNRSTGRIEYSKINTGAGGGITTLNSLTGATQTFAVGTSGTDFAVGSSGTVHTFSLPSASATARGVVTTSAQVFAGDKQFNDNIGIGISNSGTNSILIERNNNDGGATDQPFIRIRNSNPSNPSGSGYNIAGLSIGSGNDAILAQFGTSYGASATAPWNQQGFMITTRTDDPIMFWTGSTATKQLQINNNGVIAIPNLSGSGIRLVTADASGQLGTTSVPAGGPIPIDAQYTDANNTGTSETDLYTKTTAANTLPANGNVLTFETWGLFNDATATANLQFYFAGTAFGGTGALALTSLSTWSAHGTIIRTGTSTARAYVTVQTNGGDYISTATLGGLDFTATNILKVTGTAGGAGGGSNDITGQGWKVVYQP
jgi:hypothetical protein